jgi:hypothetical protein
MNYLRGIRCRMMPGNLLSLRGRGIMDAMITVETTNEGVRVTIPKGDVPDERLNWFVDSLRLEAIAKNSRLSEAEASGLADEIKTGWWAANRHRFIQSGE